MEHILWRKTKVLLGFIFVICVLVASIGISGDFAKADSFCTVTFSYNGTETQSFIPRGSSLTSFPYVEISENQVIKWTCNGEEFLLTTPITADITLIAVVSERDSYSITYKIGEEIVFVDSVIMENIYKVPTKMGEDIIQGIFTDSTFSVVYDFDSCLDKDIVVYPKLDKKVTLNIDNEDKSFDYGMLLPLSKSKTHNSLGYFDEEDNLVKYALENKTLVEKFERTHYLVSVGEDKYYVPLSGGGVDLPEYLYVDKYGCELFDIDSLVSDITLYYLPPESFCKVSFYAFGELLEIHTVLKGFSTTPPTHPTIDNYTFVRWSKDTTNIQNDIIVYAVYTNDKDTELEVKNTNGFTSPKDKLSTAEIVAIGLLSLSLFVLILNFLLKTIKKIKLRKNLIDKEEE